MKTSVDQDFLEIVKDIVQMNHSEEEWAALESSDMFQRGVYNGGYNAEDRFFAFSFKDESNTEWCFSLTLDEVKQISRKEKTVLEIQKWEDIYGAL